MLVAVVAAALGAGVALTAGAFARSPDLPRTAHARIVTEPEGASLYVGGRFAGVAPGDVRPGDAVSLRLAGYAEARVVAEPGGNRVRLLRPGEIPEGMVYDAAADLFVDRLEATVAEYARFVEAMGHRAPPTWKRGAMPRGEGERPVTGVSWEDAAAYAAWARKRLPEVDEWRAMASGAGGPMTCAPLDEAQAGGSAKADCSRAGALDMLGNVREWTASRGSAADDFRIVCGGSWERPSRECTAEAWEERRIDTRARDLGFRCVMDPPWKRSR